MMPRDVVKVIPINERGELLLDEYERLFTPRTRIVSICHVSNVLGTVNPVEQMVSIAHAHNVPVMVDGAQSGGRSKVVCSKLTCSIISPPP